MTDEEEATRLRQELLAELSRELPATEMLTVYLSQHEGQRNRGIYAALVPNSQVERSLASPSWDLMHGSGMPGAIEYYGRKKKRVKYFRFGDDTGIEPLIIDREFNGVRDDYREISEEFRLFHRLYNDRKLDRYIKIDESGNEHLVATIVSAEIKIRVKEIRQFLAIKEMHLALQFDCREHSTRRLEELGLESGGGDYRKGLLRWGLHFGEFRASSNLAFSRLLGKRLVSPFPKEKSGFWGFASEIPKEYVDFVIGADEHGEPVTCSSNPDGLANYFGANPTAPNYITPVHFRKTVLDKYYQRPQKYSVEDAYLRCASLWSMHIDNHHNDKVCAWLGDLGRDLPYDEQLHWRSHNIVPVGGVSKTFFLRQIAAEATDSNRAEHMFHARYTQLAKECQELLGWPLLLPLSDADLHHFKCVRVPATDEQRDFDEVVLGLTMILIDSLNEKGLNTCIPAEKREGLKGGISRLEAALKARGIPNAQHHIKFLRSLQGLRSSGAAHRKGSNYGKIAAEFGIESRSLPAVFAGILDDALEVLEFLSSAVRSGRLAGEKLGA
jgi:hypothetical protein